MSEGISFHVRRATIADAETIAAFNAALARESEHRELDAKKLVPGVNRALALPEHCQYFVAVDDQDTILGQAMVTTEWSDWRNGWFWWFQSVYVAPDYRRSGVFRALHQHVRTAAQTSQQCCGLRLYVESENHTARATYARLGMNPTGYLVLEEDWAVPTCREASP